MSNQPRFAVIGGGISGLTAAYRLRQLVPAARVDIFEASGRLGGVLSTYGDGNLLIERGADSFITKQPWALDLCHELSLANEVIPTNSANRRALVLKGEELYPVPEGFVLIRPQRVAPILKTPLLSWKGKLRLIAERRHRRPPGIESPRFDDSLAHFATQRLGREAFERIVEPLVAGIYTADATKLSIAATMPDAVQAVRRHGTLWHRDKTAGEDSSGARYGSFVTLRGGMSALVDKLASHVSPEHQHLNQSVTQVGREFDAWSIRTSSGASHGPFAGIVIALPTPEAAKMLADVDDELDVLLRKIEYASSAVVTFAIRQEQIGRPLDGFGFVVPRVENRDIVAASFSHVKFPGRAPDDMALIRVFLGGALRPEIVEQSDAELAQVAFVELAKVLRITGEPQSRDVTRWRGKMPQYHVGHVQLIDAIEERARQLTGIALAGNGYRGVGIPFCVRSGDAAARKVAERVITHQ
jgi:protoporphyrinogen/coproporphyrinogen III oxidase